ncbi:MAG: NUDIX hydrolase [Chloroflexi bacterium]|nr:MAG: NUDIX hydrolase [Chloroflexota bacterium]
MSDERERLLSSEQVYKGRAVRLRVDTVEKTGGRRTTRDVVEHDDCVAILAFDAEDNVLLVRQFRHAVGAELLEVPAGGIEPNETPDQAVCRELQEETGYFPNKVKRLGGFYSAPGYCTEYLYLYLATDLVFRPLWAEDSEGIELARVPYSNVPALIASGDIRDAKSIAALLSASLYRPSSDSPG